MSYRLGQSFSSLNVQTNHSGTLLRFLCSGPAAGPEALLSNKLPGDADGASGPSTNFWGAQGSVT